jgi:hypothetical protein
MTKIKVSAWKTGKSKEVASTYGIYIPKKHRLLFEQEWKFVELSIEKGIFFIVKLAPSFWNKCCELKHQNIRSWLCESDQLTWEPFHPPKFVLTKIEGNKFRLEKEKSLPL